MKKIELKTSKEINLLELLQNNDEYMPAYCGGNGTCGKCKVRFLKDAPEPVHAERSYFTEEDLEKGWRLACQTRVLGEVLIEYPLLKEENIDAESEFHLSNETDSVQNTLRTQRKICSNKTNKDTLFDKSIVAVDIGTTTIAASRIDVRTGEILKTVTSINHQRAYGADVISRIEASNNGKKEDLQETIKNDLADILSKLQVSPKDAKFIISGNTTMGHLLQGYSCKTLGIAPYKPVDISLHEYENMTILPGISAYVGADIVSGMVACGMGQSEKVSLLVDIGTNGEMAIGNKEKILVASTAAGPAFEGGNISCGIAGIPGAISAVCIENEETLLTTIDNKAPIGICGTGVIESTYELLKAGLIDETGLLDDDYFEDGYPLSETVTFTVKDVREVQLAKSAIRTGIEILIKEYGIDYDDIDKLYLAGGFGQHINVHKAVGIGLLPEELEAKIVAVGNSSLAGAIMFVQDETLEKRFEQIAKQAKEVALAENKLFQDLYMDYMFFPEQE